MASRVLRPCMVTMRPSRANKHEAGREGSQLRFGDSLLRREGCRAPGRWACRAPVEHRVEGVEEGPRSTCLSGSPRSEAGSSSGSSCAGSFARTV